ncbi:MAG: phosphoenolpyruvate carboxykinase (ATP) [Abditibacteriota bacterium]|nr:phosphoenolpyruvate carboxykinase (ATP) [Abditibacteriota bacterium]
MNISGLIGKVSVFVAGLRRMPNAEPLTGEEARVRAVPFGVRTRSGGVNFISSLKVMSTAQTVYIDTDMEEMTYATQKKKDMVATLEKTLGELFGYLSRCPLAYTDGQLGSGAGFGASCRLYVSRCCPGNVRLNYMFSRMTFPSRGSEPALTVVAVPEWPEKDRQVLVMREIGVTVILGSDYYGEIKNAFLRMAVASNPDPGFHAATKLMRVPDAGGEMKNVGVVFFGISSTGKTTLACHDHGAGRLGGSAGILQDDLVFWQSDGVMAGTENGFYFRTDRLSGVSQPILREAAESPEAVMENVAVDWRGEVWYDDKTVTGNGRCLVPRSAMPGCGDSINLPPPSQLDRTVFFFMTKNFTVIPILSRLSCEQAAVAYMLTDPFDAVGSEIGKLDGRGGVSAVAVGMARSRDRINTFYSKLRANPAIECYMLNNGGVGELVDTGLDGGRRVRRKVTRISIPEISAVILGVLRGAVSWKEDPNWMCDVPASIEGVDLSRYDLDAHYDQSRIDMLVAEVRSERRSFASRYEGLDANILDSIEN